MGLEAEHYIEMDPDSEQTVASQGVKFNSDVVDFIVEFGPNISVSVEECRSTIASMGPNKLTPAGVARILNGMLLKCRDLSSSQGGSNLSQHTVQNIWGESSPEKSEFLTPSAPWNGKVFVQALLDLYPNFIWKEVFHELDFPGFSVKDAASFRSLMESLRHGLNLQGQTRPDQYPVEAIYRKWNNSEGQLSLIKQCLNPQNFDVFCFADVPYHSCSVEILKTSGDKSYDLKEICMWKSMELVEVLLNISETEHYSPIKELFQFPVSHCPDIIILSLIQLNTPMNAMRQELMNNLFPIFLGNHVNSGVILQHAWHAGQPTIRPIMIISMSEWYLRGDYDQARLSRILDVAQDLKALPLLLNASSHVFIIDLACLASRREFLKLDKWLTDKTREHGESFIGSLIKVLKRRVPLMLKDETMPKTPQPTDALTVIVQCLRQCVGKINPDLSDMIVSLISTYNINHGKLQGRPTPTSLPGTGPISQPPNVLRSHRSMEPNFNVLSPTSSQLFPSHSNNDQLSGLGSTLAGLNLAGVGSGSFGTNSLGLGTTPGSPSRLLQNFNSQPQNPAPFSMLPGLQLAGHNSGGLVANSAVPPTGNIMGLGNSMGMGGRHGSGGGGGLQGISALQNTIGQLSGTSESHLREAGKLFTEIQPSEISKEAEDEANSYFHRIYSKPPDPTMSIDEVLELLKKFQDSSIRREREVFTCMLRNLFEEYKFFPQYPEKELHTTAQLFGGIIEHGLVTTYLQLGVALRFVVDALKKAPGSKMYYFGLAALDRFRAKLKEYPQYCQHLITIPHYQEFPTHLIEYIDFGSRNLEPPQQRQRTGALPLPAAATPTSSSAISLQQPPSATSAPGQGKPPGSVSATAIAKANQNLAAPGPAITGRPSIANATNISTLLNASEKADKISLPPESIQDKTAFIFNNLNQMNLADKSKEFKEVIGTNYWSWVAQYLVMKRASIELNFHSLYSNLLDTLKQSELNVAVLKETHRNIRILLRTDKSAGNFSDRALLKNLGHWLGMITLMKNNPIILDDLDIKSLIVEACRRGLQDLLYVVPFAAKIMESCGRSEVFKPPSPYTMGILMVLSELHKEPEMKLNLKFEIEVLCKSLNIEIAEIKPSNILKDEEKFKIWVPQLSYAAGQQQQQYDKQQILPQKAALPLPDLTTPQVQPQQAIGRPQQGFTQDVPAVPQQQQQSLSTGPTPQPKFEDLSGNSHISIPPRPSSAIATVPSSFSQMQPPIGGPVIGGLSSILPETAQEPKFSYMDVDTANPGALLGHVTINSALELFLNHPTLKQFVRTSVEKSIQDLLIPVVDRSIKYTVNACESIIKKDFALDPEESRMRIAAHHMMRYLTAGMAMITSRDHIFIAISGNLKTAFQAAIRGSGTNQQTKDMVDMASTTIAQDNMELVCVFIQKTAVEKALTEIDKRLATEYDSRKQAKQEGRRYCDPNMMAYQIDRIPDPIRIKGSGALSQQLAVYEDFSRNIPGFIPPSDGEVPFMNQKFPVQSRFDLSLSTPPVSSVVSTPLPTGVPTPTGLVPGATEDLIAIYDKLMNEMDNYMQGLAMSHSPASAQLSAGVRTLTEVILLAKSSRSVVAAITLLQKSVEGLLEGLSSFPSDSEIIRFRDAHLMVLKALQDPRAYGPVWVNRQVTKTLIETRTEVKYNVEAVDTLIRASLVNMLQFDPYLANAMEKGNNLVAMNFAMQLVQMYLVDERFQAGVSEADLFHTVDMLARCTAINRQHPEGLVQLVDVLRNNHECTPNFAVDRAPGGSTTHLHTGMTQSREFDDPSGLVEKAELLLREWIRLYLTQGTPKDSSKAFGSFIHDLNASGILKSDDVITRFFRISVQCCVNQVYQGLQGNLLTVRGNVYQSTDALVRLVSLLVRHIGDSVSTTPKINLLNKFLGIVAGLLVQDHETQKTEFQQLPFHRLFIMLFYDLNNSDPVFESISMQILTGFSNTLHILSPNKVPGFAYSWLEIIGSRMYISRMLALASDQKCWAMYCQLLLDLFKFLTPFLRNADLVKSVQTLYRGTLRVLLVILHDFPDFLCDYCYHFLDAIPPNCIQMRNLVLSAFPRNMRLPDPFTANLKFEMLADTAMPPRILSNVGSLITPANFRKDLDSYLKTRAPVTFLSELRTNLQVTNEPGTRYNIPVLNALVLYVGCQHITVIRARGQTPNMSTVAHTSHMDIFQNLAVDLDTEGRYLFLNALGNQLRFPSSHTHYFSLVILYLFGQSNTEVVQEQITRALLERLVVNRPHPWGLLVTFIELIKNGAYKFWSHEFVHCAPEVEKLFESVARSCMVTKSGGMTGSLGIANSSTGSNGSTLSLENSADPMPGID